MRIHVGIAVLVVGGGAWLRFSLMGWAIVVLAIALVLAAELANTAIEAVVDLVAPDEHSLAKLAKDMAAGAVLLASVGALAAGVLVLAATLAGR